MTRVVHCKREPYDVYVGRPGPWGNPFSHQPGTRARYRVLTRAAAVQCFHSWLSLPAQAGLRREAVETMRGRVLGCWCAPRECHGDVLAAIADGRPWRPRGDGDRG